MKRIVMPIVVIMCVVVLTCGCSKKAKEAVRPAVAVEVVRATATDIQEGLEVVGSLAPKFQADVKAEYPGIVTQVYVTEWVKVKKGTLLAQLDTREAQLVLQRSSAGVESSKAAAIQAEVAQIRATREYERFLKLKEVGLVTQQNLDDAATERDAAIARVLAAKAQLRASQNEQSQMETRLAKAQLRSPMEGVVSQRSVNVGDLTGDKMLFRIVDNRLLDLTVTVPSNEMAQVKVGQPLQFSTNVIPGKTFTGKVTFINPAVNESDRSVKIVAEVKNEPEELKAGLFVKGRIVTGSRSKILQVPRASLIAWNIAKKKADLFIVKGDRVQRKAIVTGSISGDLVEVLSGLAVGEAVVSRGGFNLRENDPVKIIEGNGR